MIVAQEYESEYLKSEAFFDNTQKHDFLTRIDKEIIKGLIDGFDLSQFVCHD